MLTMVLVPSPEALVRTGSGLTSTRIDVSMIVSPHSLWLYLY